MSISSINTTDYQNPLPSNGNKELTEDEKKEVEKLKNTDREVRAHEQAHMAAGSGIVRGGPQFEYQKGPDGKRYAVGGEVSIDTSKGKTAVETLMKMQRVRAAALAPANPSGQDLSVAAQASSNEAEARIKMAREQTESTPSPITPQANGAYEERKKQHQEPGGLSQLSLVI